MSPSLRSNILWCGAAAAAAGAYPLSESAAERPPAEPAASKLVVGRCAADVDRADHRPAVDRLRAARTALCVGAIRCSGGGAHAARPPLPADPDQHGELRRQHRRRLGNGRRRHDRERVERLGRQRGRQPGRRRQRPVRPGHRVWAAQRDPAARGARRGRAVHEQLGRHPARGQHGASAARAGHRAAPRPRRRAGDVYARAPHVAVARLRLVARPRRLRASVRAARHVGAQPGADQAVGAVVGQVARDRPARRAAGECARARHGHAAARLAVRAAPLFAAAALHDGAAARGLARQPWAALRARRVRAPDGRCRLRAVGRRAPPAALSRGLHAHDGARLAVDARPVGPGALHRRAHLRDSWGAHLPVHLPAGAAHGPLVGHPMARPRAERRQPFRSARDPVAAALWPPAADGLHAAKRQPAASAVAGAGAGDRVAEPHTAAAARRAAQHHARRPQFQRRAAAGRAQRERFAGRARRRHARLALLPRGPVGGDRRLAEPAAEHGVLGGPPRRDALPVWRL
eukprot:6652712-Prymnesium_polylepis.2